MMMIEGNTYRTGFLPRGMIFRQQDTVMETQKRLHENISALADGELPSSELELAFAALDTPDGRAAWDAYHQIGHTLRSDHFGADLSSGFGARLAARLAAEAPDQGASGDGLAMRQQPPAPVAAAGGAADNTVTASVASGSLS